MKEMIKKKGNLSAPALDNLTHPILKYERDDLQKIPKTLERM
jgi:hypothetical protein